MIKYTSDNGYVGISNDKGTSVYDKNTRRVYHTMLIYTERELVQLVKVFADETRYWLRPVYNTCTLEGYQPSYRV